MLTFLAIAIAVYALFLLALVAAGRRSDAGMLARLIPDCMRLARGLLTDPAVALRHKLALGALVAYLALPFDLVPDFIPVAGLLDDAIIAYFVLRWIVRGVGPVAVRRNWRGSRRGLELVLRAAYRPGGWRTT